MKVTIRKKTYKNTALRKSGFNVKPTRIFKVLVNKKTVKMFLNKDKAKKYAKSLKRR